ncbi:MAG: GtrA family protein [Oscillospiraceae bacterium]
MSYEVWHFGWEMVNIKEKLKKIFEELKLLKTAEGRKEFYSLHKEIILYFVFGVGTTIVSMGSYYLSRLIFPNEDHVPMWLRWIFNITRTFGVESNTALPVIISWFLSVTFAFLTNRVYVFHSEVKSFGGFVVEALKLYASRIATLFVDLLIMFILVDIPQIQNPLYEFCAKVFSNVIVLILNFILSKVFVFRSKKPKKSQKSE